MSLRRKSCGACFKSRRKCDHAQPTCGNCRRNRKECNYVYTPSPPASVPSNTSPVESVDFNDFSSPGRITTTDATSVHVPTTADVLNVGNNLFASFSRDTQTSPTPARVRHGHPTRPASSIPNFMGGFGELQRVEGTTDSWQWLIDEFKRCPRDLAMRGETLFLHKMLHRDGMPAAIRTAMGISAMYCIQNENNRDTMLRMVDEEVVELINNPPPMITATENPSHPERSLLEELARVQAFVLYQMIRLFSGGIEQRVTVDLQKSLLTTRALQLLSRSRIELGHAPSPAENWHSWIVAEGVRRTVLAIYMLYNVYSMAMHGVCVDFATLAQLPVSTSPASWQAPDGHLLSGAESRGERTLSYEEYTHEWMGSSGKTLHPFEKFLIVPCKGFDAIRAFGFSEV